MIKADVGGFVGHSSVHPELLRTAERILQEAPVRDFRVMAVGDDLQLILLHDQGEDSEEIHSWAWKVFREATEVAKDLGLYGAGQDLLKDAFSGNVRGLGPGVAEISFVPRKSEPVIVFMADKTSPGAFNLPLFRTFADPFTTAGLVMDPKMRGFFLEVFDSLENRSAVFRMPGEMYDALALLGNVERFVLRRVHDFKGRPAAVVSAERLNLLAGKYVGKDDPVAVVRTQSGFPAVGEVLEAFAFPHLVPGWMRGGHFGPLMPVAFSQARASRFDGPPRVIAAGFQVTERALVGPVDFFDDPVFDEVRRRASEVAEYIRRHGPFQPHRVSDTEYTTLAEVLKRLEEKFGSSD